MSAEEDYSRHIEGKKSKLGTSVGVVPLVSLLRLLLWVVGLAEGEMEAGCRFTPSCHHIHMCEARRTGSAEHSPRDMSEKAAPLVTALA